jgi:DNA invertase Pin-like site-specific DNA recombinase
MPNKAATAMTRCAIYARVSTLDQTPTNQLQDLRQMAAQRGLEVVREYVDKGISGARARRPALDQMMADARRGQFDAVLVWAADRIARSVKHFLDVLEELQHLNIAFISYRETIDTTGPLGRAIMVIVGAIAELERSLIIERVRAGMRRARLEGRHIGRRPLDVDRDAILHDRAHGMTLTQVAQNHQISRALVSKILRKARTAPSHKGVLPAPVQIDENRRPETAA